EARAPGRHALRRCRTAYAVPRSAASTLGSDAALRSPESAPSACLPRTGRARTGTLEQRSAVCPVGNLPLTAPESRLPGANLQMSRTSDVDDAASTRW